jgi:antitoxin component YwqK of YwqJK toxin-antitoxin module
MKKLLFILIVCCSLNGFGQETDSTIYKKYINIESVDSIFYQKQYYGNKVLWHEGWVMCETTEGEQGIGRVIISDKVSTHFFYNFGVHKYYKPNGKVKSISELSNDFISENKETFFNSKGEITRVVLWKNKNPSIYTSSEVRKTVKDRKVKDFKYEEYVKFQWYHKGKLSWTEEYLTNRVKNGCWKIYKNDGTLKNEKLYKNGKLISKSCHE